MEHIIDIVSSIPSRFGNALKTGDLFFFPSTIEKHIEQEIQVDFLVI